MIPKPFDRIEADDIKALLAHGTPEGRTLEYKETLPGGIQDDKAEFLADVTSFANGSGGDLIYGVREKRDKAGQATGMPEAVVGLKLDSPSKEILRLEGMLRDSVEPQLSVQIKPIGEFEYGPVFIVRVKQSWNAPHMIRRAPRFFSRNSSGKYPLDVSEIRQAFLLSEAFEERIRRFRDSRVARIVAGELPAQVREGPVAVLHTIPLSTVARPQRFSLEALRALPGSRKRPRFEGLLLEYNGRDSYKLAFWMGAFESVFGDLTSPQTNGQIVSPWFDGMILKEAQFHLSGLEELGESPPVFMTLTLIGVRGLTFSVDRFQYGYLSPIAFDHDVLPLPEILVEEFGIPVESMLKPVLDAAWYAAGIEGCPYFNQEGEWVPKG